MDELSCPRCRMTKYRNPSLKLKINTCGHVLCEACVELVFLRESAPCPECGRNLKKSAFRLQIFEDTRVDKEVDIRKGVLRIYNKLESDFVTLREYNDYLEQVENIIWNLENGINEKQVREDIALYKQENEAAIRRNQVRIGMERQRTRELIAELERAADHRASAHKQRDRERDSARKRDNEELLGELVADSGLSGDQVLSKHYKKSKQQHEAGEKTASLDDEVAMVTSTVDTSSVEQQQQPAEDVPYRYEHLRFDIVGPTMPDRRALTEIGYERNVRASTLKDVGGGYNSSIACRRALHDAFAGLLAAPASRANGVM